MSTINQINECILQINLTLKYFPNEEKELSFLTHQFTQLFALENSISQDPYNGFYATRIWTYKRLSSKLKSCLPALSKIKSGRFNILVKLPYILNSRAKDIEAAYCSVKKMPLNYSSLLNKTQRNVEDEFLQDPRRIDKNTFHLVAEKYSEKDLENLDINSLEGNWSLFSLIAWHKIIQRMPESPAVLKLRVALEKAFSINRKIHFFLNNDYLKGKTEENSRYYQRWAQAEPAFIQLQQIQVANSLSEEKAFTQLTFQEKRSIAQFEKSINVSSDFDIPHSVFINDMAWDAKQQIAHLNPGEYCFFNLGIYTHTLVVQVYRQPNSSENPYSFTIFNTGSGVIAHHKTNPDDTMAKPWIVKNLPLSSFSYEFLEKLFTYKLTKGTVIGDFYKTCKEHFKVSLKSEEGEWHFLQNYGTCTYTSMEVFLLSHLDAEETKHFNFQKNLLAVQKQTKLTILRKRKVEDGQENIDAKKFKASHRLLELSRIQLQASETLLNEPNIFDAK